LLEESLASIQNSAAPVKKDNLVKDKSKTCRQWLMRTWNEEGKKAVL
jgi:hypothetical protein